MAFFDTPSLASATSTRLDTACRHMQQCRVSYDHMLDFVGSVHELERNKMQYCVHKDEMAVGVARPWAKELVRTMPSSAYPRIISNLGNITLKDEYAACLKMIKYLYHFATSIQKKHEIIEQMKVQPQHNIPLVGAGPHYLSDSQGNSYNLAKYLPKMFDFYPVGFATTLGYAHPNSGDNMSSVMIGGLRTVMNGDFEVFAGDQIQWYWTFERDCFHDDGKRKKITDATNIVQDGRDPSIDYNMAVGHVFAPPSGRAIARRGFNDYQYGVHPDSKGSSDKAKHVARIKAYIRDDAQPRLYDWYRVFAIAISSSRPNEMVDIKIGRQSM